MTSRFGMWWGSKEPCVTLGPGSSIGNGHLFLGEHVSNTPLRNGRVHSSRSPDATNRSYWGRHAAAMRSVGTITVAAGLVILLASQQTDKLEKTALGRDRTDRISRTHDLDPDLQSPCLLYTSDAADE